jgi:hypothetical protein
MPHALGVNLEAVILAVTAATPRVLTTTTAEGCALPAGPLDSAAHATLERGLREWVQRASGFRLGYVEQLYTFGDRQRDPRLRQTQPRTIGIAYLALTREQALPEGAAHWHDVYDFLPWEDWRRQRPELLEATLAPALLRWAGDMAPRRERVELVFGLHGAPWDTERALERYELLWEAGLVPEAGGAPGLGLALMQDHRRILATALGRMRGKLRYRPVVFELLPERFTLSQLQQVVEALTGRHLHTQNFRRLIENAGLVEATGAQSHAPRGRPAALFRFRREVLRERPQPGVHYPGAWRAR